MLIKTYFHDITNNLVQIVMGKLVKEVGIELCSLVLEMNMTRE